MSLIESGNELERTLHERFGLEQFRPGQREVIEQVLEKRDVLCVMPTGGGKSLCYQLPALLLPGLTLVVSPLIALMKDQVDALRERGLSATLINSTLDPAEQRARMLEIEAGRYELVYVAPERFRSRRFVEMMAKIRPALLAVDEAHCISEWGHDFRPDYARLGHARRQLGSPPCIALTATATDVVRRDIADQLDLQDPAVFVTGFDRPNLGYAVIEARREADKLTALAEALDQNPGPAIVYASSRARCESVAHFLERELRRETVVYHAGVARDERAAAQERFMRGDAEVVVATNAFGMGVDKSDIRSVIHFNIPGTLEAYYQEAGRAGRDGLPAHCLLLYAPGDRFLQELFIENEYPPAAIVYQIYNYLRALDTDPIELTQLEIKQATGIDLNEQAVGTALKILEGAAAIERFLPRENMAIVRINAEPDDPSLVGRLHAQAHIQRLVLMGLEGLVNRRFNEPVYFHPDEFSGALGIDRPALSRALKALVSELPIDYVPPFRGHAIRVIDRKKLPTALEIDFPALEKRKRREYDKLDRMIRYAQTRQCRRSFLLSYFGDATADRLHCGHCDNCGSGSGGSSEARAIDTPGGREVILKILSGVARARGRFGKVTVAQMLNGSGSEKMDRFGLKRLSTYGILPTFKQQEIALVLDALIDAGFVASVERDRFPVVNLTERGWEWLRAQGTSEIVLSIPDPLYAKVGDGGLERLATKPSKTELSRAEVLPASDAREVLATMLAPSDPGHDGLEQRLRALRTDWAREAKVPPYCVFPNTVLDELSRVRPRTPQALAAIKGLGPAKIERYGKALLETIDACAGDASPRSPRPDPVPPRRVESEPAAPLASEPARAVPAHADAYVSTEEWTWRLLDRGFNLDEAAAIRGLDRSAVIRHATWAARQGRPVDPRSFLNAEVIADWSRWRSEHGDESPPPDSGGPLALWGLFVACTRA
ncbi:MAG: RecQ family ATP-dependent DNA helicase [Isosphaeraceae bacterium]|nr:RecQ family ATP-dependent DNA helicase [Isosphaeraceae bacterium]